MDTKEKILYWSVYVFSILLILGYAFFIYTFLNKSISEKYIEVASDKYKDSPVIVSLANNCSRYTSEYQQVQCVNEYLFKNFKYVKSQNLDPEITIRDGADCKGASVFYQLVFSRMNITSRIISTKTHNFVLVVGIDYYCIEDQRFSICQGLDIVA